MGEQPTWTAHAASPKFYWRITIQPHWRMALVILLLMLGSALLETMTVGLTVPLLDVLTDPTRAQQNTIVIIVSKLLARLGVLATSNVVTFALLVLASGLFITRSGLFLLYQCSTAAIANWLRRDMKSALFAKFLTASYDEVSKQARGRIVYHINNPADNLYGAMINIGQFVASIFSCTLMIGLMIYLSWWVTLMIGALAIGGIQGWRILSSRRAMGCGRAIYELQGEQSKVEVDAIDGLKVVKAFGLEGQTSERHKAHLIAESRPTLQLAFFRHGPDLVNEVLAATILLGLGAIVLLFPSFGMRFSMLAAFLLAVRRIAPAAARINSTIVELNRCKRSLETVEDVLHRMAQERRGGERPGRIEDIRLVDLSFSYSSRPRHRVLNGITTTMRRGTSTAVVGPTGSGKSTIANLLVGLYQPQAGTILVNGRELQQLDLSLWRRSVGYVAQDVFVFNTSIRENIALGDHASAADVEWAARIAQLDEFVASLPEGYDTLVGDRGLRLSGGQCQRLAIARAILRRPEVLIFDEATSALDNLTERAVYDAISALHEDAIVIVIAHRLSTVKDADQIVVLHSGHVVEIGTHDRLMHQGGIYAKIYEEAGDQRTKAVTESASLERP